MSISGDYIVRLYDKIKENRPIIHCITNDVTINDCANVLLAIGASPTMAHHPLEAAEITEGTSALVCNFGAIEDYDAMLEAAKRAGEIGNAIIADPVGVSGSSYRRKKCIEFIERIKPSCIRGNYSEIRSLACDCRTVTGVDAAETGLSGEFVEIAKDFAKKNRLIVVASGPVDVITDGNVVYFCDNGDSMMARITGSGCMSSVIIGAFLSMDKSIESAASGCAFMGISGEVAAFRAREKSGGTMTFRNELIDAVSLMDDDTLTQMARIRTE